MTQKTKLALLLALTLACLSVRAQRLQASLLHYSTDDGLASNAIADIRQDDYGYIWVATWNGLSRFDGYHFYNYQTGNASHIPHLHNRILAMTFDKSQNVWLRMYDNRIFVLNRRRDVIINPFNDIADSEEYRARHALFKMSNGDILASVDGIGIYKMRLDKDSLDMQLIFTGQRSARCFAEGYHEDIWAGTDQGLHRIDLSNRSIERQGLFEDEDVTALFSNGYNIFVGCRSGSIYLYSYGQEPRQLRKSTGKRIQNIFVDSHGLIWFADSRFGVSKIDPATMAERHYEQYVPVPEHDGAGGTFNEVYGTLWISMNHGGYGYYNRKTDEVEYFHNDPVNPWNLSNTVNASCELPEGIVYMSTSRQGLEKLEILKYNIPRTLLLPESVQPTDNEVRGICYDPQRKLLLMGNKSSMLFMKRSDGSHTIVTTDSDGHPIGRVYGISKDSKGRFWICSKDHGIFMMTFNANGGHDIRRFCHDDDDDYSLSSDAAYQVVEDKQGNIWIATYGGGVNVLTRNKEGKTVFLNPGNAMPQYPKNSYMKVRTIALNKDGKVWAGTTDGILALSINNREVQVERLKNSVLQPDKILMSTDIVCLATDKKGDIWVGTNGGGLAHALGTDADGNWLFESLGSKDGLPSEEIKSITFDLSNNVWFATGHILSSYDVSKRIFTTFSTLDGVDETLCSESSALCLPNGNVLFGTLNGYYTVDRKKLVTDNVSMMKLRITDFIVNGQVISPRLNSYCKYYVPEARQVSIQKHDDTFGFRFAAMNYHYQQRIHYQYMLEGYDKEWRNADRTRTATYADVPGGTYQFKVKAFLLDSPDKYDLKTIEVTVPPHPLLSGAALWIYAALAVAALLALMLWQQKRQTRRRNMKVLKLGPQEMAFVHQEDYDFVKSQLDWLEANFANPDLKIEDLVAQSGLDRTVYYEQMKELTGQSPKEFVSDFRIKKAVMFVENTSLSVAEIASRTGYSDPVNFTRTFKQKTGLTPSKYREQKSQEQAGKTATTEESNKQE